MPPLSPIVVFVFMYQGGESMQVHQAPPAPVSLGTVQSNSHRTHSRAMELAARDMQQTELFAKFKGTRFAEGEPSPWKPVEPQFPDNDRNICFEGKQVPDFYVLGVQKCATTTLAENLMGAGMNNVHGDLNPKEFHWFDHRMDYDLEGAEFAKANRDEWLKWMPQCPEALPGEQRPRRNPLADFTPDYLRIVPRPQDMRAKPDSWMRVQELDIMGPEKMRNMYGQRAGYLSFAIMVREPLAQMQSAWYHAASFNFTNACQSCEAPSFKAALNQNLYSMRQSPPILSPWIWTAMYARQLKPWLDHFDASQFYIIPYKQLTSASKDNICKAIAGRLEFNVDCNSGGAESLHSWSHEHRPVDEDAGDLRAIFDQFMDVENAKLVSLLATASMGGMGLANYNGQPGDETAIKNWLAGSW